MLIATQFSALRPTACASSGSCPILPGSTDFAGLDAELGLLGAGHAHAAGEFVAVIDNAVCGSVIVSTKGERTGKLSGFYVSEGFRGRGIGRALLQAAVQAARDIELDRLYLETWGRMAAAVRLYESTGWVRGEDLPTGSGADRSYWLELSAPNKALQRSGARVTRSGR
ncbi:MAG: GNAT family N-acetyltransferase [Planctomycetes bacterium]|nr:GNAT family N-acetyltransferase [Planctomycetota bacterium]